MTQVHGMMNYLNKTRLVEEVPEIDPSERFYIWHDHKTVWRGPTKAAGEAWATENGIMIEQYEPFEP